MFTVLKWLLFVLIAAIILIAVILTFGSREKIDEEVGFDPASIGSDLEGYLSQSEAQYSDIKDDQEKQIIWSDQKDKKTNISIVYIHGFSASLQEIRPVPDNLAKALGANLFYTRLPGHGRPGVQMGDVHANEWMETLAEATEIGRRIGQRVILVSASTGGTLIAAGLDQDDIMKNVEGIVFVSPNFGLHNKLSVIGRLPFARIWAPLLAGESRSWEPLNELHGQYWTTEYPPISIVPMMSLIAKTENQDFAATKIPALFYYSEKDTVVRADVTQNIAERWGGGSTTINPILSEADDPNAHVISGDIMSPNQTGKTSETILNWIKALQ